MQLNILRGDSDNEREKSMGFNYCIENKINKNVTIINSRKQNGTWERKNNPSIYIAWLSCEQCLHRHNNVNTDY